jgi:hypothetical protein
MISQRENVNFKWINHIKSIFDNVGLTISPYDIKLGVLVLILRIFLQNCKRIFSNTCTLSYPQTSHPYVRMSRVQNGWAGGHW